MGIFWPTIDVNRGAAKAFTYDMEKHLVDQPHWDKETTREYVETKFIQTILAGLGESEKLRQLLTFSLIFSLMTLVSVLYLILRLMGYIR